MEQRDWLIQHCEKLNLTSRGVPIGAVTSVTTEARRLLSLLNDGGDVTKEVQELGKRIRRAISGKINAKIEISNQLLGKRVKYGSGTTGIVVGKTKDHRLKVKKDVGGGVASGINPFMVDVIT